MKKLIYFLAILFLILGCKKDGGKLLCTLTYNIPDKKNVTKSTEAKTDAMNNQYTQFGEYITSITPSRFLGKFLDLRFFNNQFIPGFHLDINLIDNKSDITNPHRLADFSNNSSVSFIPEQVNVRENVELIYFAAICLFFYQELELPQQYESITVLKYLSFGNCFFNNFDGPSVGGEKTGCFVKASHEDFLAPIFDSNWTGFNGTYPVTRHSYVFGNTDSTFIFYSADQQIRTIDNPQGQNGYIVRSNKYTPVTISAIPDGDSKTIKGTMSFNITDLIQIYAGQDNIAYTRDDIFVYAPNFWERISVILKYD
jgi:hypothetical protein